MIKVFGAAGLFNKDILLNGASPMQPNSNSKAYFQKEKNKLNE
jgi:hypothetical protein